MELLISIENFEVGDNIREINSPRTLEACLRSGLDPQELYPKSRSAFVSRKLTKEMIDIKFETFERKRRGEKAPMCTPTTGTDLLMNGSF
jgi:hypothetical protein